MDSIGFVGTGEITAALVRGLNRSPGPAPAIYLSPRGRSIGATLAAEFDTVTVCGSNDDVLARTPNIVVAVRPTDVLDVLRELRFDVSHVVISVVAGVSLTDLAAAVDPATRIVRAVPLPSVARGDGLTPMYPADPIAEELFSLVGEVVVTNSEAALEALSAASATMAAHIDYLDTIAGWLADHGVPPELAVRYMAQTLGRLGESFLDLDTTPGALAALAQNHTTPGGLNEQFAAALRADGLPDSVRRGLDALLARVCSSG